MEVHRGRAVDLRPSIPLSAGAEVDLALARNPQSIDSLRQSGGHPRLFATQAGEPIPSSRVWRSPGAAPGRQGYLFLRRRGGRPSIKSAGLGFRRKLSIPMEVSRPALQTSIGNRSSLRGRGGHPLRKQPGLLFHKFSPLVWRSACRPRRDPHIANSFSILVEVFRGSQ